MSQQELIAYIKQNLEKGIIQEQIWQELKRTGWQEDAIKRAFQELGLLEAAALPGLGDLLERTFRVYKENFWILVGIMLPPFLVGFLGMLIGWLLFLIGRVVGISLENADIIVILWLILLGLIFFIILAIISLWSQASLLCAIRDRGQKMGIKKSFARGWRKIISYWLISVLSTFMVLGGFLLFFVPGIILAVWFSLASYILIAEDKKGFSALLGSKQLIVGNWWTVFWRQILIFLMVMGAGAIVSFIPWGRNLAGLITTPFVHIFGFLLYQDLKRLKGDSHFETPKTASKIKFILVAAIGYLLPAIAIGFWLIL